MASAADSPRNHATSVSKPRSPLDRWVAAAARIGQVKADAAVQEARPNVRPRAANLADEEEALHQDIDALAAHSGRRGEHTDFNDDPHTP